jgi:hypothetical protein
MAADHEQPGRWRTEADLSFRIWLALLRSQSIARTSEPACQADARICSGAMEIEQRPTRQVRWRRSPDEMVNIGDNAVTHWARPVTQKISEENTVF